MTSRKLLTLSLVALLAIAVGVWLAARQSSSGNNERTLLYPELKQQLDAVQAVRIFKAGDARAVELVRSNDQWVVNERSNYAADAGKLRTLLRNLAEAKVLEEKTSNAQNYSSLGVEDVKDAAATGARIEVSGAPTAVNLIVGKAGSSGSSQYVRRAGEPQSWLVDVNIDAAATPDAWLRREVIDVSADRIHSAAIATGGHKPYTAAKASRADADFAITDLPRGKQPRSASVANSLATALAGVTLSDVQPASALADAPTARATFRTFDGLVIELSGRQRDDKRYIEVKASHDPALAERFKVATTKPPADDKNATTDATPDDTDRKAAPEKNDAATEATSINARVAGWAYEIPSYKYEQIFKPVDELI